MLGQEEPKALPETTLIIIDFIFDFNKNEKSLALGLRFQAVYRQVTKSPQLFHHQVRDGLVWVQLSLEHQGFRAKLFFLGSTNP